MSLATTNHATEVYSSALTMVVSAQFAALPVRGMLGILVYKSTWNKIAVTFPSSSSRIFGLILCSGWSKLISPLPLMNMHPALQKRPKMAEKKNIVISFHWNRESEFYSVQTWRKGCVAVSTHSWKDFWIIWTYKGAISSSSPVKLN